MIQIFHKSFDHTSSNTRSQDSLSLLGCYQGTNFRFHLVKFAQLLRYGCGIHTTGEKSKWFPTLARKTYGSDCQSIAISCTTGFPEQSDAKRTMDLFKSLLNKSWVSILDLSSPECFLWDVVYCTVYLSKMTGCSWYVLSWKNLFLMKRFPGTDLFTFFSFNL